MKLVIDTSIIIDHIRGGASWNSIRGNIDEEDQLFIPTIVIFELYSGQSTKNTRKMTELIEFIDQFRRMELTEEIAEAAGRIARDLKTTLQSPDYIIAASALSINAEVITLNTKHFEKIPGLKLYSV